MSGGGSQRPGSVLAAWNDSLLQKRGWLFPSRGSPGSPLLCLCGGLCAPASDVPGAFPLSLAFSKPCLRPRPMSLSFWSALSPSLLLPTPLFLYRLVLRSHRLRVKRKSVTPRREMNYSVSLNHPLLFLLGFPKNQSIRWGPASPWLRKGSRRRRMEVNCWEETGLCISSTQQMFLECPLHASRAGWWWWGWGGKPRTVPPGSQPLPWASCRPEVLAWASESQN